MAKRISDLTTTTALQSGDYFEVSRATSSLKRDMYDELADNLANVSGLIFNVGVKATVAASALTIYLTQADGASNPSTGINRCRIGFRSATLSDGSFSVVDATATTSTVISVGSTAGLASAESAYIHVYALNNAGAIELAWSASGGRDEDALWTTTAEGGAGAADSRSTLYSTTARSNVAIRWIGRLTVSEVLAGSWTTAPTVVRSLNRPVIAPDWIPYPAGTYVFPSGNKTVTAGVLPVGAATTAPTFGTGTTLLGYYRDWGKTIDIMWQINQTSTSGAAAGSGAYLLPIPLGKLLDTTISPLGATSANMQGMAYDGINLRSAVSPTFYSAKCNTIPISTTLFYLVIMYTFNVNGAGNANWGDSFTPNSHNPLSVTGIITGVPVQ